MESRGNAQKRKVFQVHQIRIPGDILLGGVFPVHAKASDGEDPCGEIAETRLFFFNNSYLS